MNKAKLKLATILITVIFVFSLSPAGVSLAATRASGSCGSNLSWTLSDTGTLTISGSGNMDNWMKDSAVPWYEYRSSIKSVVFSGNITSIGKYSFHSCSNLSSIRVPDSVTLIDNFAFYGCTNLKSVNIPNGVNTINSSVFYKCSNLTSITIPSSVTKIGSYAFEYCTSLSSITIPSSVTEIGTFAFSNCQSLINVTIPSGVTKIWQSIFNNCKKLKTVSIPNSVTSMGYRVFTGCESLTDIYFAGTREKFVKFDCYSSIDKSVNIHYGSVSPLSITTQPKDFTGTVGSTATFSVVAQGSGLTYQWQTNYSGSWTNISLTGSKTSKLSLGVTTARNGIKYRCVVKDSYGNTVASNAAAIYVSSPLSITTQPKDFTGAVGSTATFSVAAQGTGLTYQWQTNYSGSWTNISITGSKTSKLSLGVTTARNGIKYRCVVKDSYGNTAVSNAVAIHVASSLSITTQPKDYSGRVGSTATFSVVAQGTGLTYQWQTNYSGSWTNISVTGSKTSKLSLGVTTARNGIKYRCVVKDTYGNTVASNAVAIRVSN